MEEKQDLKPLITFVILFLTPLQGMGIDIYTPSLPHIVQYFSTDPVSVKLTMAAYLLGYALSQPFFGTISDVKGRRKPLLWGLISYFIFTLFCAFSPTISLLIIFRVLQGIAIGASATITKSILTDSFKGTILVKRSTYMSTSWALGPIIAPAIGGYLQHYIGWQANFYFLALYCLLGILFVRFLLVETNKNLICANVKMGSRI